MNQATIAKSSKNTQTKKITVKKSVNTKINTPFGYFGSKNKIALQLATNLPPHNCWVEAFCGSAALTLAKQEAAIEIINDIDDEIINVFKQLRDNHKALCKLISLTPYARQELKHARIANKNDNKLERARKFLVQAMMAINGVFGEGKGGFSYSQSYARNGRDARVNRWYNLPTRLSKVVERLRDVRIENRDAIDLLKMFIKRPATLVYLDPPYLCERTMGYNKDINDEKYHSKLIKLANKAKCMIFISGYDSDLYKKLLTKKNGWKKKTIDTVTKCNKGKSHNRCEVVWMNKHFQKALKTGKVPITLTEKEFKHNKLNPER